MIKSEDRIQQECYMSFHNKYPQYRGLLFHVPNGGKRDKREAKKFKSMGLWPGVSDFIFLWKGFTHMIELKTEDGSQSPAQKKWEKLVETHGFPYYIVRNVEKFDELIEYIMNN